MFDPRMLGLEYLTNQISLLDLDKAIVTALYNTPDIPSDALQVATTIQLVIDEYTSGAWSEPELKAVLRSILVTKPIAHV